MRSALRGSCLCADTLPTVIETMSGTSGEGDSPPLMPLQWLPINLAVTFTLEFICTRRNWVFGPHLDSNSSVYAIRSSDYRRPLEHLSLIKFRLIACLRLC